MRKLRSNNGIFLFFVHDKPNILLQLKNKEEVIASGAQHIQYITQLHTKQAVVAEHYALPDAALEARRGCGIRQWLWT